MRDRNYLLIKGTLRLLASMFCCVPFYYFFDNKTVGLSISILLVPGVIFWTVKSTIRDYQNKESEVIYNGFNLKGQVVYIALLVSGTYLISSSSVNFYYYSFYGICCLLLIIENGVKLMIFDFSKKQVTGLFDNERQKTDQLTIDHIEDGDCYKIKVTDKTGFFLLDKNNFTERNWARLLSNLDRIKA